MDYIIAVTLFEKVISCFSFHSQGHNHWLPINLLKLLNVLIIFFMGVRNLWALTNAPSLFLTCPVFHWLPVQNELIPWVEKSIISFGLKVNRNEDIFTFCFLNVSQTITTFGGIRGIAVVTEERIDNSFYHKWMPLFPKTLITHNCTREVWALAVIKQIKVNIRTEHLEW